MKLIVNGMVNLNYCQNLCLMFFPGAKFPEHEESDFTPEVIINVSENDNSVYADASIKKTGRIEYGHGESFFCPEKSHDRIVKIAVGYAMLEAGSKLMGSPPPWGILTGVRPTKIAAELKRAGLDKTGIIEALMKDYKTVKSKAELLAEVIETETCAVSLAADGTCSLYVSIPFCPTRCEYCSFVSYSTPKYLSTLPDYLDTLCLDIENKCAEIREKGEKLLTVYIGGGTPTILSASQLDLLLSVINKCTAGIGLLEFTVEAGRPDTVTEEKFDVMLSHGVDRTSINPQILNDTVLQKIGRNHTVSDFYRAYDIAVRSGIWSVNTDLIAGLPGADLGIFSRTVDEIIALSPQNVTVHTYCVKKSAGFTADAAENGDSLGIYSYDGGQTCECVDYSQFALRAAGYLPYYIYRQKNAQGNLENVGFTKPGFEGLYNIFIMEELQNIYAVGAGAVSKTVGAPGEKIKRIFEPKYSYEYLKKH